MKKITLLMLSVLFVAAASMAQSKGNGLKLSQKQVSTALLPDGKNAKQQPAKKTLQMQQRMDVLKGFRASVTAHAKQTGKDLTKKRANAAPRRAAADIIYDQPEGTLMNYSRSGSAYVVTVFGVYDTDYSGAAGSVVFGADNKVYFKKIISQAPGFNTWIEGTINGGNITIKLPQTVGDSGEGYGFEVAKMSYDENAKSYVRASNQTVTLKYNATTGAITTPSGRLTSGLDIIGLSYDDDQSWTGYGDWDITYEKVTDELVEAPADLTTETYSLVAEGYVGSLVNVGFAGDEVYVQGIDANLPETWAKGTISGNKVTFKGGQYLGADEESGYHQYLMAATAEELYDDYWEEYYTEYSLSDGDITFDYDAATKTLSNGSPFLFNAGKSEVNYLSVFDKAKMEKFVEVPATPAAPVVELSEGGYEYYSYGYGWGSIYIDLATGDVDGNYTLPEKTSYKLWVRVNGEEKPLVLSGYDYVYQEELAMTEIPFDYSDNWDIGTYGGQKYVYYYVVGPEAYGVQTIYRGGGEEHASEISWAEVYGIGADVQPEAATPDYPDATISDSDNKIAYGYYTGDEDVSVTTNNYKPETYDVAVKFDDPALVGTLIESITFPLQTAKGVSDIAVFLTSQLRVENGKNVADLVQKTVTPAEGGFITVMLDKPYTIPEGGVYVGYSMTVNDVSREENATPVAVINQYNDGGYYLHTSDGILKWIDFGELTGLSALVQIRIAGGSIKENTVVVADGVAQYVKVGEDFRVPVTLVNYGSKGIQSVDVTYTVADKTGTQHITADVDGFYGKKKTVSMNIPAISQRGNYELVLSVDKVNNRANENTSEAKIPVVALNSVPKHRALLEEYTGTWCGWCPRGYVGLEKLAELYPDDYVLVSYHNGDDMEIMSSYSFPSDVQGFPDAWIDRVSETDAFYGKNYGVKELGVADDLAERSMEFGQADIDVTAALNENGSRVNVSTSVTFPYDVTDGTFALEYILTADGLSNEKWGQANNYSGGTDGGYLQEFNDAGSTVYGLVYNDVAVLMSQIGGIEGSIPATVAADKAVAHSYTFNLAKAVNTGGAKVIQDKSKLKVVVLLINTQTGEVVNANKVAVISAADGIMTLQENSMSTVTERYNAAGQRIAAPQKGLNIIKHSNGMNIKVMVK